MTNHTLSFRQQHLSITQFEDCILPQFTILTGVNGSGKSHLLQAIQDRKAIFQEIDNPKIVHFNAETFRLENEPQFSVEAIQKERQGAWDQLGKKIGNVDVMNQLRTFRKQHRRELDVAETIAAETGVPLWDLKESDFPNSDEFKKFDNYRNKVDNLFLENDQLKVNNVAQSCHIAISKMGKGLDRLDHEEFLDVYEPYNLKNSFLPIHLGKSFADYFSRYETNQYNFFRNKEYGESRPYLDDAAFVQKFGPKPWDLVNDILSRMRSVPYQVDFPENMDRHSRYTLRLRHTKKAGIFPQFNDLSSGEKILMALVASIYKADSDQRFPDILLLDEIDASLHPSMMKNLLEVISKVFLANEVKTIMVSHSPTTIALAPEESIFVVNPEGTDRIEKKDRQEALDILTEGFATLDEGLRLFNLANSTDICVITEGRNVAFVNAALKHFEIDGVSVITGAEDRTGKTQLKTLYDFFTKVQHDGKITILWDCDCSKYGSLEPANEVYPYVMPKFEHAYCERGIENAFPEFLFNGFIKTTTRANGDLIEQFDESEKASFERYVIDRDKADDFAHFNEFAEFLRSLSV